MKKFELVLKNDKLALYDRFMYFFIVINILSFGWIGYVQANPHIRKTAVMGAVIVAGAMLVHWYWTTKRTSSKYFHPLYFAVFWTIFTWVSLQQWWLAVMAFLLVIIFTFARRRLAIVFLTDMIIYPSVPKKIMKWNDLHNVILKDGIVTMDFKTNKILQAELTPDSAEETNEAAFNRFCEEQLHLKLYQPE